MEWQNTGIATDGVPAMPYADQDLAQYLAFAHQLANAAGAASLPLFRTAIDVDNKDTRRYDPDGGDPLHGGTVLACGDPALHQQLLARLA